MGCSCHGVANGRNIDAGAHQVAVVGTGVLNAQSSRRLTLVQSTSDPTHYSTLLRVFRALVRTGEEPGLINQEALNPAGARDLGSYGCEVMCSTNLALPYFGGTAGMAFENT